MNLLFEVRIPNLDHTVTPQSFHKLYIEMGTLPVYSTV